MSGEQIYIKNIENAIRAIKLGSKSPSEVNVSANLTRLKSVNEGMALDLMQKYKAVVDDYNKKSSQNES